MKSSFGPVVIQTEGTGELRAACVSSRVCCTFLIGRTCTHARPSREVEDSSRTPDWCEMRAGLLADVAHLPASGKEE